MARHGRRFLYFSFRRCRWARHDLGIAHAERAFYYCADGEHERDFRGLFDNHKASSDGNHAVLMSRLTILAISPFRPLLFGGRVAPHRSAVISMITMHCRSSASVRDGRLCRFNVGVEFRRYNHDFRHKQEKYWYRRW